LVEHLYLYFVYLYFLLLYFCNIFHHRFPSEIWATLPGESTAVTESRLPRTLREWMVKETGVPGGNHSYVIHVLKIPFIRCNLFSARPAQTLVTGQ
jgi:hypothetical protein